MRTKVVVPLVLAVVVATVAVHAQTCAPMSTSTYQEASATDFCGATSRVLPYDQIFVPAGETVADLDAAFEASSLGAVLLGFSPPPQCYTAAVFYACPLAYANCTAGPSTPTGLPVCQSSCLAFKSDCAAFAAGLPPAYQAGMGAVDCSTLPATAWPDCLDLFAYYNATNNTHYAVVPSKGNSGSNPSGCPAPLIANPFPLNDTTPHNCVGDCCIPCPLSPYLYPPGWIDALNTTTVTFSLLSWVLSLFTLVTYSVLPNKRGFPSHIILNIAVALVIFYSNNFMHFGPNGRLAWECEDYPSNLVDLAVPGLTHNSLTKLNGFLIVYGILAAVIWYGFLVLNIFMSVVFLSTRLGDYPYVYHAINWFLPWISIIVTLACNQFGYLGLGQSAAPNSGWWMDGLLMIPIAVVIFPSVILNVVTLSRITIVGLRRNASFKQILRLQIRPFLFVVVVLFIFLVYWINYEVALKSAGSDLTFILDWITCLRSYDQATCYYNVASPYIPAYGSFFFSQWIVTTVGIVQFAFFGLRKDVILGWYYMIKEGRDSNFFTSMRGGSTSGRKNHGGSGKGKTSTNELTSMGSTKEPETIEKTIESLRAPRTAALDDD